MSGDQGQPERRRVLVGHLDLLEVGGSFAALQPSNDQGRDRSRRPVTIGPIDQHAELAGNDLAASDQREGLARPGVWRNGPLGDDHLQLPWRGRR